MVARVWPASAVRVCALSAVLGVVGVVLLMAFAPQAPALPLWGPLVSLAVLTVAFALAESFLVHLPVGRHSQGFSLAEVPLVVGLFVTFPGVVVVARLLGAAIALFRRRVPVVKQVFTAGQFVFETSVIALVWLTLLGDAAPLSPRGWVATMVAVLVGDLLSGVLLALVVHLHDGTAEPGSYLRSTRVAIAPALANSAFALTVVFVVSVDWRAFWLPGAVSGLLYLGHRANLVLTRRHDELQQLNEFAGSVVGDLRVEAVVNEVITRLSRQLHAHHVQMTLFEVDSDRTWRLDPSFALDVLARLPSDAMILRRNTRSPGERALLDSAGLLDAIVVALPGDEGPMGSIVVGNRVGDHQTFDDEDLTVLQALANHTAAALRNAVLADQLRRQVTENEHQALHDALTDLPNRRLFALRIDSTPGTVAVVMMDLDGFKDVNDALGHGTGDVLLQLVAQRLTDRIDRARCIARIGGDEFVIALDVDDEDDGLARAAEVRAVLAEPFSLTDMTLSIDASIGVAVGNAAMGASELLKRSDVAMYEAKASRAGVRLYDAANDRSTPDRLLLPSELREAIRADGLAVHYQPKATLADDHIESFEALVRWIHPRRGMVSPAEFIPLAEQTGLIVELTHHVLQCALRECRAWRDAGHDVSVAVNMSPRVLHDEALPDVLAVALMRAGVPATALTLEITESDLMADPARAVEILQRLADMGITLSVDDLGTGYSSLAYLKRLPVHEVKIDRSFVMGMGADDEDAAIVEAVVALGQRLGKRVVAEGVEDEVTMERLRAMGCDVAQGYWLSRPMPAGDVLGWLAEHAGAPAAPTDTPTTPVSPSFSLAGGREATD